MLTEAAQRQTSKPRYRAMNTLARITTSGEFLCGEHFNRGLLRREKSTPELGKLFRSSNPREESVLFVASWQRS